MATAFLLLLAIIGALLFVAGFFTEGGISVFGFLLLAGGAIGAWKRTGAERERREALLQRIADLEENSRRDGQRLQDLEAAVARFNERAFVPENEAQPESEAEPIPSVPQPAMAAAVSGAVASVAEASASTLEDVAVATALGAPQIKPPLPAVDDQNEAEKPVATVWGKDLLLNERGSSKQALDFEQALGSNWLSKIGIAILVLGIAFFLAWQLTELGPKGKVLVGVLTSAALIGAGSYFERNERYRTLARAAVAGGWPLLFFVAYAAHFVQAAKVIESTAASLGFMLLAGGAMLAHTLRYRSQWVTSLAFMLAFTCVTLNRVGAASLSANVVLAAALAVVVLRMRWHHLEVFGILAVYINHFYWLMPIIEPMQGKRTVFPEFYASIILLALYWAIFRASFLLRRAPVDERLSVFSAILNSGMLLAVLKYQAARPELAFWGLLALGAAEIGLGALSYARKQRTSFAVVTTIGCALCVAAIPFRYTPDYTSPLWLVEAAALLMVGLAIKEVVFRRLGLLACGAVAVQLLSVQLARVAGVRMDGAYVVSHRVLGLIITIAVGVFFVVAHIVPRKSKDSFPTDYDRTGLLLLSSLSAVLLLGGSWAVWYGAGAALAWMGFATVLFFAANNFESSVLLWEAVGLCSAAIVRALAVNLYATKPFAASHGITERLVTMALVTALLYLSSRIARKATLLVKVIPTIMRWVATLMVMLLAWHELRAAVLAVGWAALALILFEIAQRRSDRDLHWQSQFVLGSAVVRLFFSNLNITSTDFWRIATVTPVVLVVLYVYEQTLRQKLRQGTAAVVERYVWFGAAAVSVAALLRFEMSPDWVAAAWAAIAAFMLWTSWRMARSEMLASGLLFAVLACTRGILHNLYERSYFPPASPLGKWPGVLAPSLLLLMALPFAYRHIKPKADKEGGVWRAILGNPQQTIFFAAFALTTALLWTEASKSWLTIAWSAEGVAVFFFSVWLRERSFRLSGLVLLLICVAKIILMDVWTFAIRERALTFIALGIGLLAVSVLYSRKRELLREIL
jgi:hypothetical protein